MKREWMLGGIAVAAVLLSGCVTPQQRAAQQAQLDAYDDRQCQDLNFRPGSEAYGNCRLKMREIRTREGGNNNGQPNVSLGLGVVGGF